MTTRHTERSTIDLACRHQIQDYIRSNSTTVDVTVNKLEALVKEGIQGVTNDSWSGQLSVCNTFNSVGKKNQFSPENGSDERFHRKNSFVHITGNPTDVFGIGHSVSFLPPRLPTSDDCWRAHNNVRNK